MLLVGVASCRIAVGLGGGLLVGLGQEPDVWAYARNATPAAKKTPNHSFKTASRDLANFLFYTVAPGSRGGSDHFRGFQSVDAGRIESEQLRERASRVLAQQGRSLLQLG